jgi:hypothetical protein
VVKMNRVYYPLKAKGIVLVVFSLILLISACQRSAQPQAQVEAALHACLLEISDLPDGWQVDYGGPQSYDLPGRVLPGRALGGVVISFVQPGFGARAYHEILRYDTSKQASRQFERESRLPTSGIVTPWETPDLAYTNESADSFQLACADYGGISISRSCSSLAQYDRFLSRFDTWVSPAYMGEEDLVKVLTAIDRHMVQCVNEHNQ